VAREIDLLVVRGHEVAGSYEPKPVAVREMTANPGLLHSVAVVLLARPITREDIGRILGYTPPALVEALVDNNISEKLLVEREVEGGSAPGLLELTDLGRAVAEGVVELQEDAIGVLWNGADEAMETVASTMEPLIENAPVPPDPSPTFSLFAGVCDRPTLPARVLRLITVARYWRADAHRRAVHEAGLRPNEAHALNVVWDSARGVTRVGQGHREPGTKGLAALRSRGLAGDDAAITPAGVELRERIEHDTDVRTAPLYGGLDRAAQDAFLGVLRALPR
jgi:hypothetical protein